MPTIDNSTILLTMHAPHRFQPIDTLEINDFIEFERDRLFIVHQNFLEEYGAAYDEMVPRFAQKRHDPNQSIDKGRFEYLMGPDVAHDTHPISLWGILRSMIACQPELRDRIGREGVAALEFAEITHDFGEAVLERDIAKGEETPAEEAEEQDAWVTAIENTAPPQFKGFLLEVVRPIIFDDRHPLHIDHDVAENIGYILTGMRASRYAFIDQDPLLPHEIPIMSSIARDVRKRQSHVQQLAPQYRSLENLFHNYSREWDLAA